MQAPLISIVEQDQVTITHIAVEGERQVHDGVLQTLTAVHGQYLNGGGITVEATIALGTSTGLLAPVAQPVPKRGQRKVLAVSGLLQQLCGMRHVGHIPFAAAVRQQPICHAGQARRLENRCHTVGSGVVGPFPDGLGDLVGQRITAGGKIFGAVAEEHRGSGRPHDARAVRLVECLQQ